MSNDPQKFDETERAADKISNGAGMNPVRNDSDGSPEKDGAFLHGTDPASASAAPQIEKAKGADRSILLYTVLAVGFALVVRFFIAAPYLVSGPSMEPTFQNHDYLIVDRLTYDFGEPQRGDVVIFTLPINASETLIKRVIGVPGDTVAISATTITITNPRYPKGIVLSEPYLDPSDLGGVSGLKVTLAADQFFVLGDNRKVSYDSRLWGTLPRKNIVGRVLIRLYPLNAIGIVPGEARYQGS